MSESGNTARLLSKYRPSQPIIACVMDEQVQRQLSISWGITPLMMDLATSTDELIEKSTTLAKEHGYLHDGELAVVTAGVPVGVSGTDVYKRQALTALRKVRASQSTVTANGSRG